MSDATVIVAAVTGAVGVVAAVVVLRGRKSHNLAQPSTPTPAAESPTTPESSELLGVQQESTPTPALPESEAAAPAVEQPAPARGRMRALSERLGRSNSVFGGALLTLLSDDSATDTDWESVEDTLIMADLGVKPAADLVASLRRTVKPKEGATAVRAVVREQLLEILQTSTSRELNLAAPGQSATPQVFLVVGVNGTGKTTTTGKLARMLVALGYQVHLAAADTFRAAAADQLQTWADRVGVSLTRKEPGADPAAVAYEGLQAATAAGADILLVDTAGRLHTKAGLMDELGKVVRVLQRQQPISEALLVLDATTGQNGLAQARVFAEVADITGVVLTKLDGTAKGGVVVAVQRELAVPVKLVGLGEGPDDLADFEPGVFVDALLA